MSSPRYPKGSDGSMWVPSLLLAVVVVGLFIYFMRSPVARSLPFLRIRQGMTGNGVGLPPTLAALCETLPNGGLISVSSGPTTPVNISWQNTGATLAYMYAQYTDLGFDKTTFTDTFPAQVLIEQPGKYNVTFQFTYKRPFVDTPGPFTVTMWVAEGDPGVARVLRKFSVSESDRRQQACVSFSNPLTIKEKSTVFVTVKGDAPTTSVLIYNYKLTIDLGN